MQTGKRNPIENGVGSPQFPTTCFSVDLTESDLNRQNGHELKKRFKPTASKNSAQGESNSINSDFMSTRSDIPSIRDSVDRVSLPPMQKSPERSIDSPSVSLSSPRPLSPDFGPDPLGNTPAVLNDSTLLPCGRLEPWLRQLLIRYVPCDSVLRCLELAGFTTAPVLACLADETQLSQFEECIRSTCQLMPEGKTRASYLGPVFARRPERFRLPAGAVCGLRLAIQQLSETDKVVFVDCVKPSVATSDAESQTVDQPAFPLPTTQLPNPVSEFPPITKHDTSYAISTQQPVVISSFAPSTSQVSLLAAPASKSAPKVSNGNSASMNKPVGNSMRNEALTQPPSSSPGLLEDEQIDLERLTAHATASAIRLASRQFVNAQLMRCRDFDIEMELSYTPDGQKRVTGIFYCHLCREKRERTSAVRFSIARNRHPVMSNVLSHLKMHFQYKEQPMPSVPCLPVVGAPPLSTAGPNGLAPQQALYAQLGSFSLSQMPDPHQQLSACSSVKPEALEGGNSGVALANRSAYILPQ